MNNFLLLFTEIIGESWFWQGIIINTSFTLASLPFTNKMVQKIFRNRKRIKIKNARKELEIYCLQQLLKNKHLNKEDFENQIYMIASRYKLDIKDVYNDKNTFFKNLTHTILEVDLLDDGEKERISNRIRKEKVFTESDYKSLDHNSTLSDERERDFDDEEEYIELDRSEKKEVFKYTSIIISIIFISLLLYMLFSQVLFSAYGVNSIIFINTIFIIFALIPILINGIMHFKKFDECNKIFFLLSILISILNIINFIRYDDYVAINTEARAYASELTGTAAN